MTGSERVANWTTRGKSVRQLIEELQSFADRDIEVRLSWDMGDTDWPISLVGRIDGKCVLMCGDASVPARGNDMPPEQSC